MPTQEIPSFEYAIVLFVPSPTATHLFPFHAIPLPIVFNTSELVLGAAVQVIPSLEYPIVFVPCPTATHLLPFHATLIPVLVPVKTVTPRPVQKMPSFEVAILFVPWPTATQRVPFHAIPVQLALNGDKPAVIVVDAAVCDVLTAYVPVPPVPVIKAVI